VQEEQRNQRIGKGTGSEEVKRRGARGADE